MKQLIFSVVCLLVTSPICWSEASVLALDVSYQVRAVRHLNAEGNRAVVDYYLLEIRSILTNVGSEAIVVPTSTYDGRPSRWFYGIMEGIEFDIDYRSLDKMRLVSPRERYFPVTLAPGESTELPAYERKLTMPEETKKVIVIFSVSRELADTEGWWTGEVEKVVDFKYERKEAEPGATDNPGGAQ